MAAEVKQIHTMSKVMLALVQMKDSSTSDLLLKLMSLFENFAKDNAAEHKACIEKEEAAVAHYNATKARL